MAAAVRRRRPGRECRTVSERVVPPRSRCASRREGRCCLPSSRSALLGRREKEREGAEEHKRERVGGRLVRRSKESQLDVHSSNRYMATGEGRGLQAQQDRDGLVNGSPNRDRRAIAARGRVRVLRPFGSRGDAGQASGINERFADGSWGVPRIPRGYGSKWGCRVW